MSGSHDPKKAEAPTHADGPGKAIHQPPTAAAVPAAPAATSKPAAAVKTVEHETTKTRSTETAPIDMTAHDDAIDFDSPGVDGATGSPTPAHPGEQIDPNHAAVPTGPVPSPAGAFPTDTAVVPAPAADGGTKPAANGPAAK